MKNYEKMPKDELMARLPDRSWNSIMHRAQRSGIRRDIKIQTAYLRKLNYVDNPMKRPETRKKKSLSTRTNCIVKTIGDNRLQRLKEVGWKCQVCGCKKVNKQLHLHHLDGDRTNNKEDNILVVCRSCHSKLHDNVKNLGDYARCRE